MAILGGAGRVDCSTSCGRRDGGAGRRGRRARIRRRRGRGGRRAGRCRRLGGRWRLSRCRRRHRAGGRLGFQLVIAIGGVLLVRHQALGDLGAVGAAGRGRRLGRHRSQIRIGLAGRRRLAGRGFRARTCCSRPARMPRQQPECCAPPRQQSLARARFRSFYGQSRFRLSCPRRVVMLRKPKELPLERIIEEAAMADQQPPDMKLPDPVELSRAMARIAEQSQRLVAEFLQRQAAGEAVDPVSPGHVRPPQHRQGLHGDDGPDDEQSGQAGRGPGQSLARLYAALAVDGPAHGRQRRRADDPAQGRGSPLQRFGLAGEPALRFHQAILSAERPLDAGHRERRGRARPQDGQEGRFLYAPVRRCHGARAISS